MSEPDQQPSGRSKALGCLVGLVGGGLAFVSVINVVGGVFFFRELNKDVSLLLSPVGFSALGLARVAPERLVLERVR
jgi:hypothetical protein